MNQVYTYNTGVGPFQIVLRDAKWHAVFKGESLGNFATPQQAAEDLVGGHFPHASGFDTSTLGIPEELSGWIYTVGGP